MSELGHDTAIRDKIIFHILAKLGRFGHEKLPLQIIKEKQSYIVGHRRKRWKTEEEFLEEACKLTYVQKRSIWKLYWKRADLRWHLYKECRQLDDLLEEVRTDPKGCFWG